MIVHSNETKKPSSLIDLLGGSVKGKNEQGNNAFAQLLLSLSESAKVQKTAAKQTDFTALIDPKKGTKVAELQTLLIGDTERNMLPKELLTVLSNDQVHALIHRAKEFLKNEIMAKAPDQQLDPKTLPKTLMGLVQLADKMGLDPTSITLSHINKALSDPLPLPAALEHQLLLSSKAVQEISKTPGSTESTFEAMTQLINDAKAKETKQKKEGAVEQPLKSLLQASDKANETKPKKENTSDQPPKSLLQASDKANENTAAVLDTPKVSKEAKQLSSNSDLLIGLLQGEIKTKEGESSEGESKKVEAESSKPHTHSAVQKADALEVKTKEAAQSMRFFVTDLKEAVESYKPPFTRLTMTLNPEKLGEVEVTLVQRGNSVHVNIQSNNTNSVAFLAHNATELKAQLTHQGITNATMNFMSGGEGHPQNQSQQQQQQQNRFRAYESLQDLELNQEQLSALEIIIPHYA